MLGRSFTAPQAKEEPPTARNAIGAFTTLIYGLIMGYLVGPQQEKSLRLLVMLSVLSLPSFMA